MESDSKLNHIVFGDKISKAIHYANLVDSLEDKIQELQRDILNLQKEVTGYQSHASKLYKESGLVAPLAVGKSVYSIEDDCVIRRYLPDNP